MNVWMPCIRTGSGADAFAERLTLGLSRIGVKVALQWFSHRFELLPDLLRRVPVPAGTDIIHTNSWNGYAFARSGIPSVVTVHHCVHDPAYGSCRSWLQSIYHRAHVYRCERLSFSNAAVVVADSRYTQRAVEQCFEGVRPTLIYPGIEEDVFSPAAERQPGNGRFRLLYVGNNSRRKGFDLLRPIMAELGAGFELWYTGGLRDDAASAIPHSRPLGRLSPGALLSAYQQCDALLFPSRYEGFGFGPCEASACGRPVITTRGSSLSEVVEHEVTGLLCSLDNVDEFVHAARRLAADSALAKRLGEQGRARVVDRFSLTILAEQYAALYRGLTPMAA